mmetsp:Transcript_10787/g.21901  ORF Transcript_10787/g.21901 Transcript_10787/m.21901 type:complete len:98 (+) Transcript_10787:877-1170(+)
MPSFAFMAGADAAYSRTRTLYQYITGVGGVVVGGQSAVDTSRTEVKSSGGGDGSAGYMYCSSRGLGLVADRVHTGRVSQRMYSVPVPVATRGGRVSD